MVRRTESIAASLLTLVALALLNGLAANNAVQIDTTKDQRHTLAPATLDLLHAIDGQIDAHLYAPAGLGSPHREIAAGLLSTLSAFKAASGGRLRIRIHDPTDPDLTQVERQDMLEEAAALGLESTRLKSRLADRAAVERSPFGVAFVGADRQSPTGPMDSIGHIEYELASALSAVVRDRPTPTLGISTRHGEPKIIDSPIARSLASTNRLEAIELGGRPIPRSIDALLIFAPTRPFDKETIRSIEAFLVAGGAVILFADYLQQSTVVPDVLVPIQTGLEPLFARHGLSVESGLTIIDRQYNAPAPIGHDASGRWIRANHPLFARAGGISTDHPITRNITDLILPAMSPIALDDRAIPLVWSREQAQLRREVRSLAPENLGTAVADRKGPFVGIAATVLDHEAAGTKAGRLLIGTSARRLLSSDPGALRLLQNAVDWSLSSTELTSIRGRVRRQPVLRASSPFERALIRYGSLLLPSLLFLLLAWLVARRRSWGRS